MHPALSIIVFTTLCGHGYGLAAVLGLGLLDPAATATKVAHLLALAMISGGLLSSTLHLGNPQRAWRALSQWRSSWLSREGVMAILAFLPLLYSAWASIFEDRTFTPTGILGAVFAGVTVYCTAMIYASLRSVQAWNTWLTPLSYLLFSVAGGLVLATFFAATGGGRASPPASAAILFLAAAWTAKGFWRKRMLAMQPLSTPESATGLGPIGRVKLFERPHVNENYLTHEMGYVIARKHAAKLSFIALLTGGALPVMLLLAVAAGLADGPVAVAVTSAAVLFHGLGIFVERWLFFAEARHAVMNYYGG